MERYGNKLTEKYIQDAIELCYAHSHYFLRNLFVFDWESDVLYKTRVGYWYEIEIKLTISDFKNDIKHKTDKFRTLENGDLYKRGEIHYKVTKSEEEIYRPNYFSYCVPHELTGTIVSKGLLPEYAGLYGIKIYDGSGVGCLSCHKHPIRLHSNIIDDYRLNLAEKFYFHYKKEYDINRGW